MTGTRWALVITTLALAALTAVPGCTSSGPSKPAGLLPAGSGFAGKPTTTLAPPGLGFEITVPASWRTVAGQSGFAYSMEGPPGSGEFLLADRRTGFIPLTPSSVETNRIGFLTSHQARISSTATGLVGARPAVRLEYRLTLGHQTAFDTEYDIISTSSLPVGASQNQREYSVIVIVFGSGARAAGTADLKAMASTIRLEG